MSFKPFIKWAGGKEKELPIILENLPKDINNYFEPFVGGGAVFFAMSDKKIKGKFFINDKSDELIELYSNIRDKNADFFTYLHAIEHNWSLLHDVVVKRKELLYTIYSDYKEGKIDKNGLKDRINSFVLNYREDFNGMLDIEFNIYIDKFFSSITSACIRKFCRTKELELSVGEFGKENTIDNIETALKSAFYTHFRYIYNNRETDYVAKSLNKHQLSAIFYFIREFCYASMFRYNSDGGFNVPYGGMAYNDKDFLGKITKIESGNYSNFLKKTEIGCKDFYDFMNSFVVNEDDFIFLDPPYDTEFSEYAQNEFSKKDQIRLADYCAKCCGKIMIVIKETDFIRKLYEERGFKIKIFEKTYLVNFQNRNDRKTNHLLITNY